MDLFAGYQLRSDARFVDCILDHANAVREVYFSWPGVANGRNTRAPEFLRAPWEAQERQLADLARLREGGLRMNLLLNGACYGADSLARDFYSGIGDLIDALDSALGLHAVTTTSPVIARFVKQNFPQIETRASVNMEIGTREGVEYMAQVMDGFYVKREMNRSIEKVRAFAEICHGMGKKVYLLANSGCLNYCSARQFHDNLVAHESEIARRDNAFVFDGQCRQFLSDPDTRRRILRLSNWIRPEDLDRYEGIVDGVKLATRVSRYPEMIVRAYAEGHFSGNLLTLTEPDFSDMYLPQVLSADRMPEDFFEKLAHCGHDCASCGYCERTFEDACERIAEDVLY